MKINAQAAAIPSVAAVSAPGQGGRRHRRRDSSSLSVTRISTLAGAEEIRADWRELHERSGSRNPYASPDWLIPWARHFVRERDLALLAVSRDGVLIGLAPWYTRRTGRLLGRVQLLGSGRHDSLTELPQVLTAPEEARSVLRAALQHWSQEPGEWDWLELPMLEEQGWFEPEWLTGAVGGRGFVQHKVTRPSVVFALPQDVPTLHRVLKRNLLESTHRARNRLDRTGRPWVITSHSGQDDIGGALGELARLHTARAVLAGRRRHGDQVAVPERLAFLAEALSAMARRGRAEILTLDVEGTAVAAQLVLRAPDATYLGPSGVDPAWWNFGPVTLLQLRAAESAVERGHGEFNLSTGPVMAKLRWSEQIMQNPEFVVCGPRHSSRVTFTAYRAVSAVAAVRRNAAIHRIKTATNDTGLPRFRRRGRSTDAVEARTGGSWEETARRKADEHGNE
jgi:CelD/BcsL family acetyltransferase involved in cellulose biosynthesis